MATRTGGCLCGAIRYEVTGDPIRVVNCHCDDCRKATGAAFATNVFFKDEEIRVTQGTPKRYTHTADSGSSMNKEFCGDCGSQLFGFGSRGQGMKSLKAGSLDDPSGIKPMMDIYLARKLDGIPVSDETEHHEEGRPR